MKAAVTYGNGDVSIAEIPMPEQNPWQCLCRMLACASCSGTDRKIMKKSIDCGKENYPGVLGHESVGTVLECGERVKEFRPGDLVIRPTAIYPTEHFSGFGSLWGAFAEYGLVTDMRAFREDNPGVEPPGYSQYQMKISSGLVEDPADAVMMITLKEVVEYAASVGIGFLSPVMILGAGSVGLFFCRAVKLLGGFPLIVAARNPKQREAALRTGADEAVDLSRRAWTDEVKRITGGNGVARIIDTTGSSVSALAAVSALAEDGFISPYATYSEGELARLPVDRILHGKTGEVASHPWICSLLRHGMTDFKGLYSHRLPFRMIADGMKMLDRKEASKVVFDF